MRIRDYIRDGLAMGQKRENKSGLPGARQCRAMCYRPSDAKSGRKTSAAFLFIPFYGTQACIIRAVISAFLPHLNLAAIDFRYTKPHVT
ncbi:hypothetical protein [Pantoea sp. GD03673]|uniref:hypothetical protein n=1 Tax=Pantoea sp. GD03673 TaxID=2975364 RepID=UPI0024471FE5|nr:hypothetical protein [Pantoea sp. GD03673]MDH2069053.1 hypothetical protein [Pantoea sp. GD03673]